VVHVISDTCSRSFVNASIGEINEFPFFNHNALPPSSPPSIRIGDYGGDDCNGGVTKMIAAVMIKNLIQYGDDISLPVVAIDGSVNSQGASS
jgi:hypothetical protein